jgi:hypothetical protein
VKITFTGSLSNGPSTVSGQTFPKILDMYTGFTPTAMLGSDNIHPNSAGYKFMPDRWYSAIGSLLPK